MHAQKCIITSPILSKLFGSCHEKKLDHDSYSDAFVVDRVFEAVLVEIETRGAGFHFEALLSLTSVKIGQFGKVLLQRVSPRLTTTGLY